MLIRGVYRSMSMSIKIFTQKTSDFVMDADMDQKLEANWQRRASMAENFSDSAGGRGRRFSLGNNKKDTSSKLDTKVYT
jgi:hypothetical protein